MSKEPATRTPLVLAPRWHTALLVALIVSVAVAGTLLTLGGHGEAIAQPRERARNVLLLAYLPLIVVQLALAAYVSIVARAPGTLRALVGRGWDRPARALIDFVTAALLWVAIVLGELGYRAASVAGHNGNAGANAAMLPHTLNEKAAWVLAAVVVGTCEEIVYRGYLQTQLTRFLGGVPRGIAAQAVLFGIAHASQGPAAMARFAVYGALFGVVARARRSLVPGMLCHVWTDAASGLFGG
ncbi:MAG: Abortive infection protein [Labilithrix sp.]|nr:Abortive infection protein [Labilithrix sp.]